MQIGHFKNGLRHGAATIFDSTGEEESHSYFEGKFGWKNMDVELYGQTAHNLGDSPKAQ
jgi:hypothetical protein